MRHGKYETPRPRRRSSSRTTLVLACIALLLTLSVGGTLAYIVANTSSVRNEFVPGEVACEVVESGNTISVKNSGNVPAYLRATVVVNWMDGQGNVIGTKPDVTIAVAANWEQSNGIYYYKEVVPSGQPVDFITDISEEKSGEYTLTVEVVAEAIQAEGMGATSAQDAWARAKGAQG